MLYTLMPELYVHQINKLGAHDKARFKKPRISYTRADGNQLEVDKDYNLASMKLNEEEALMDKTLQMEMYLLEQTSDVFHMYSEQIGKEVHDGGHANMDNYLLLLDMMDPENMKDWERRLWGEVTELRAINADIKALQQHLDEKPDVVTVPKFI